MHARVSWPYNRGAPTAISKRVLGPILPSFGSRNIAIQGERGWRTR